LQHHSNISIYPDEQQNTEVADRLVRVYVRSLRVYAEFRLAADLENALELDSKEFPFLLLLGVWSKMLSLPSHKEYKFARELIDCLAEGVVEQSEIDALFELL
jgi:hypothetical protein